MAFGVLVSGWDCQVSDIYVLDHSVRMVSKKRMEIVVPLFCKVLDKRDSEIIMQGKIEHIPC